MMKLIQGNALYAAFLERYKTEGSENLTAQGKTTEPEELLEERRKLEKQMQLTLRKFLPNNSTGSFTVMRQKIEKLVDDGYTFTKWLDPAQQAELQARAQETRILKSPLELRFEERERIRLLEEEKTRSGPAKSASPEPEKHLPVHKRVQMQKEAEAAAAAADVIG